MKRPALLMGVLAVLLPSVAGTIPSTHADEAAAHAFRRIELQNDGDQPIGSCSLMLLNEKEKPIQDPKKRTNWYVVDADEVGYGPRVAAHWVAGVGFSYGTTMLPQDACDAHRTFLPQDYFAKKDVLGVRGARISLWVLDENRFAEFCATSEGILDFAHGPLHISPAARDLAGVWVSYEGIRCRCRVRHHVFAVRTYYYCGSGPAQRSREDRLWMPASLTLMKTGVYSPDRLFKDGDGKDGPGAPKPFSDFELRNSGNKQIKNARVKGHRPTTSSMAIAFQDQRLVVEGLTSTQGPTECNGSTTANGFETGPEFDYNQNDDACRRQYPGNHANVTGLVYSIEIGGDSVELCISSKTPDQSCAAAPNACVNNATCPDGDMQYPLNFVIVDYQGQDDKTHVHTFKITRGVYQGGAQDLTVTTEEKCCNFQGT